VDPISLDDHETFRNELASVAPDGRRRWVYARKPSGRFYRARTVVSVFLLAFLCLAPFVRVHGAPLMLLDVLNRRFILLGVPFWPQDFYLVVLIGLAVIITLALSTAAIGRVWCGWLCPQTIFMEMVFRKIEYLIEGSAERQLRRDRAPWTVDTALRKGIKQAIFFALSFVIANIFLAYVIGSDALRAIVTDPPGRHLPGLIAISLFSFVFYAVFARFREQACTLACPYGRMMSSLIDRQTVTVTYDVTRGEPRTRLTAAATGGDQSARGDCIDCHQCVTVCPMGIDIRNGIQLECVNCTACIDACDAVMTRVNRPTGLIRLTSDRAMRQGRGQWLTTRVAAYGLVWLLVVSAVAVLILRRQDLDIVVFRQPGTLFTEVQGGAIANFYTLQAFNRTTAPGHFDIEILEPVGAVIVPLGPLGDVAPGVLGESRFLVQVPRTAVTSPPMPVRFVIRSGAGETQRIASSFLGPVGTRRHDSGDEHEREGEH
jgi:cytochrome c oxidase accessory protein FixG